MSDEVERLEKKVKEGKEMRNNLEQYTRKDNIKIINLQGDKPRETSDETEKRVVDFLHSQLGLTTITSDHISIAHRVGPYRQSQNRPIIVKFISRKTKVSVMKNKRNLKGQKIYINEDLTKLNAQRLAELKKHIGVLSAWSFEGSLYCKLINLEKIKIEDGGIGVIDRLLIDTPRSQQQGFQQRPGGFGVGRAGPPSLAERYARHGAETGAGQQGTVATAGQQDRPALGDRRPGHPPPPALGDRRPGHPPPLTDQGTEATAGQQDRPALGGRRPGHPPPPALGDRRPGHPPPPALGDRRPGHPPPLTDQGTEATAGQQDRPALGGRRPGHPPPLALGGRRPGHPPPLTDWDLTMRSDHRKGGRYPWFQTEGTSRRYSLTT
ncbi:hypothetical protein ACOMHN_067673 [Nucella lapillus]